MIKIVVTILCSVPMFLGANRNYYHFELYKPQICCCCKTIFKKSCSGAYVRVMKIQLQLLRVHKIMYLETRLYFSTWGKKVNHMVTPAYFFLCINYLKLKNLFLTALLPPMFCSSLKHVPCQSHCSTCEGRVPLR